MNDKPVYRESFEDSAKRMASRWHESYEPELNSGCHLWTGNIMPNGYGKCFQYPAHRTSYFLHYGINPGKLVVRHKCDTPACVNPTHLEVGTQKDNAQDAVKRGRHKPHAFPRGKANPNAKLTPEAVLDARATYASGQESMTEIAKRYGVNKTTIRMVVRNRNWLLA